ncbi:MAG: EAL domain-containing protein [Myxococcales bacterium FL481]|nr:MAG: EAL domain-containing protein [Myxococcales bacterium FL481]
MAELQVLIVTSDPDRFVQLELLCESWPTLRAKLTWETQLRPAAIAIGERRYDVAIVDDIADLDAFELLRLVADQGCPVLVLFASHDAVVGESVLEAGAADWLAERDLTGPLLERAVHYAHERDRVVALLRRSQERARHRANHDGLTGLANRTTFLDRVEQVISYARTSSDYRFCVMVLDVDRFKVINESLGHEIGDQLIVEAAQRLKGALREQDLLARLGGDEFAVVLDGVDNLATAETIATALQRKCGKPFYVGGHTLRISTSLGLTYVEDAVASPEEVLREADSAMYGAKSRGRSCYVVYGDEMRSQAMRLFDLESEMRLAVESREFEVFYQPIYDAGTMTLIGCEALVRWRHARHGLVSPAEFIPIAEETGLIVEIGQQVLQQACDQVARWNSERASHPPLSVSVNLSAVQFHKGVVVKHVAEALESSGLAPNSLHLEITESLLMQEIDASVRVLAELQARGISVDLDDFGTGYSSLSYLADLPVSRLKIDRAFVSAITEGSGRAKIAQAIISLAHSLDLDVTAEGVENEEQLAVLQVLGCQHVQGFLFSPPVPARDFEKLWRDRACA